MQLNDTCNEIGSGWDIWYFVHNNKMHRMKSQFLSPNLKIKEKKKKEKKEDMPERNLS